MRLALVLVFFLCLPRVVFAEGTATLAPEWDNENLPALQTVADLFSNDMTAFQSEMASTPIFALVTNMQGVDIEGDPVMTFDFGAYGQPSVDFSQWNSTIFLVLHGMCLCAGIWFAIKTVTMG